MAVRGITYSKQAVSSNDDSHIYKVLLNGKKGKTKGCNMTFGTDNIFISEGLFFAANRLNEITSKETIPTPTVTETTYFRLVFEIDLSKTNTSINFLQGYFKLLSSTTDYPAVTQEDLDNGGFVYQLPFARFTKTISGIGSFVSELETIGCIEGNQTIYVKTSGNDFTGDGTSAAPFKTIQKAIDSIPKDLNNREITINVASGTYAEDVIISGFNGGTLRFSIETITISSLTLYESNVILTGTKLTIAASGKTYGFYCHRGGNAIVQTNLIVNGSTNGVYASYGSRFSGKSVTINSCTNAVVSIYAAHVFISSLAGSKNNNGVQASGAIASIDTITTIASTQYVTSAGGRIYTGAQASAPLY